jgi:hypothetical protein
MPVVIGVATFHLMRGGGGAPEKSGWELEHPFDQRNLWKQLPWWRTVCAEVGPN